MVVASRIMRTLLTLTYNCMDVLDILFSLLYIVMILLINNEVRHPNSLRMLLLHFLDVFSVPNGGTH